MATTQQTNSGLQQPAVDDLPRDSMDEPVAPVAQRTMRNVLDEAQGLTRQLAEAQAMCAHVVKRFETIAIESSQVSPPPPMAATNSYKALLLQYVEFLKRFANEKVVLRLVHNRIVVQQNLKYHNDIDNLLKGLQLPEGNEVLEDWKPEWEAYRDSQCAAFEVMSGQKNKLIENLNPFDTHAQTEALGLLMYEYNKVTSEYTPAELKVLYKAFTVVSRFSKNTAPTIATWFLPPYQFEFSDTAFAFGGFGNVHHGKHCGTDVAVKCVNIKPGVGRAQVTAAFVKEANLWFKANNIPNVVRLYGANHLAEKPYFVSEFAANGTLKSYVFEEKNRHQVWKLLLDAAYGIRALHQLRILHNDLKCDNIVVSSSGQAKIMDFGLCCELPRPNSKAQVQVLQNVGAVPWKAPELLIKAPPSPPSITPNPDLMAQPTPSPPSIASDVYSFGMCVLEAVSNSNPWDGWKDVMIKKLVKKGELPPRPAHVFEDNEWNLVERMCAWDPAKRLSMDQVVELLTVFENREGNEKLQRQNTVQLPLQSPGLILEDELDLDDDHSPTNQTPASLPAKKNLIVLPTETTIGMQRRGSLSSLLGSIPEQKVEDDAKSPPASQPSDDARVKSNLADSSVLSADPHENLPPDASLAPALPQEQPKDPASPAKVSQTPSSTEDTSVDTTLPVEASETAAAFPEPTTEAPPEAANPEIPQPSSLISSEVLILPVESHATTSTSERTTNHNTIDPIDTSTHEPESEPEPATDSLSVDSATITDFRFVTLDGGKKQIVQYQVEISLANGETRQVWKRFSAFRNFRKRIRSQNPAQLTKFPAFPSRFTPLGNLKQTTIMNRCKAFSEFLAKVLEIDVAPFGVLISDGTAYFKDGARSKVLL